MIPLKIARAVFHGLHHPPGIGPRAGHLCYGAGCLAAQLSARGVAVRIDPVACQLLLDECVTIPLHTCEGDEPPPCPHDAFIVRGVDVMPIPYRYCFGETPPTPAAARRRLAPGKALAAWLTPVAMALSALCAFCRLLLLLTPAPTDLVRTRRQHQSAQHQCECRRRS